MRNLAFDRHGVGPDLLIRGPARFRAAKAFAPPGMHSSGSIGPGFDHFIAVCPADRTTHKTHLIITLWLSGELLPHMWGTRQPALLNLISW